MANVSRVRVCKSKKPYDTLFEAEVEASKRNWEVLHENIHAYKCPFCNVYHIGHKRVSKTQLIEETYKGKVRCPRCLQIVKRKKLNCHGLHGTKELCEKEVKDE